MSQSMDFERFMNHDYDPVIRAVTVACGDARLAQEAVHEALVRALERTERDQTIDNPAGWITVVAIHWTNRWHRRRRLESTGFTLVAPLNRSIVDSDDGLMLDIATAVVRLPLRQRQVIVLHYLHGYDVASVAGLLGVSSGTIKTCLSRARIALAVSLADHDRAGSQEGHVG